ncbi:protein kinase [Streptomyces sp. NPDC005356]|uniref:protein kinase domain-containing protein n=1 Tax=Streptomyces sp. NPDC005356 TaxID=3157167 RepID=UPI0033AE3113
MPDETPPLPLQPGDPQRIGDFTLLGRLGSGGMGTVFLARTQGGRVVALKTVREELAREPEFRIRFRLEAEAARAIGARHGARVVDVDTQGTIPWMATEYLLGPSLDEAVQQYGPLPEPSLRALGARLADALADIHGTGLVHRDLKPSNILITAGGPRVIDFGIARALGARRLTRTGQAVGTPAYMSPEQAGGRDHEPPGDVFALGGVLVYAATGHGPFAGDVAADVLYRVRYDDPDLSGVPEALLPVLRVCLAKDPDQRPDPTTLAGQLGADTTEFATILPTPLLNDIGRRTTGVWELRPVRVQGPPPAEAQPRPSRRRLLLAGAGAVAALGAGASVWAAQRTDPSSRTPRTTPATRAPGTPPKPLWRYDAGAEATVRSVRDGVVVISVGDEKHERTAVGLDAKTGNVIWRQQRALEFDTMGQGTVVRTVPASQDEEPPLHSLDASTGRLTRYPGELRSPKMSAAQLIAMTPDTLYLQGYVDAHHNVSAQKAVAAYATQSGEQLWLHRTPDTDEQRPGVVTGDVVLYSTPGDIVALLRDTGSEHWRTSADNRKTPLVNKVYAGAVADGRLIDGGSQLRCLDTSTGRVVWRFGLDRVPYPGGTSYYGTPVISNGTVYVLGIGKGHFTAPESSFDLLALRASDGTLLWTYNAHTAVKLDAVPYIHDGIFHTDTGRVDQPLLAVDLTTHRPPWAFHSGIKDDGRLPEDMEAGRTALAGVDDRLYLSCGATVLAMPAT